MKFRWAAVGQERAIRRKEKEDLIVLLGRDLGRQVSAVIEKKLEGFDRKVGAAATEYALAALLAAHLRNIREMGTIPEKNRVASSLQRIMDQLQVNADRIALHVPKVVLEP